MAKKKKAVRRKKQAAGSIGLSAAETRTDAGADALAPLVERDGGAVLGAYRDPFGGKTILIVSLPIDRVEPTPYQRDPSDPHVKRLMTVIETLDRFLDPLIVVRHDDRYWTPNGNHRLQAMRRLGAKAVVALLISGSGGRLSDPRAEYRESAQSEREVARNDPDGPRAGRRLEGAGGSICVSVRRALVSDAGRCVRITPAPERCRLQVGAAPDRRVPRQAALKSHRRARTPGRARPEDRRSRHRDRREAQGTRFHQSVSPAVRHLAD